ncbi:Fc receptor-like protein 2 [Channa argus]|uniref:Fc receptor-like protein 2 n=1 Tax=Channa argus TaxID=215402 RepID=UPI0035220130
MGLTTTTSGFIVFLLSVPVVQVQNDWKVNYNATQTCAPKGSTVDMSCTYTYPSTVSGIVIQTFWFMKLNVDLTTQSEYAGRAEYVQFQNKQCTLRVRELRETDSTTYKFRFITSIPKGRYTGEPGVRLTVTALQIKVTRVTVHQSYNTVELNCSTLCSPDSQVSYMWVKNGQNVLVETPRFVADFYPGDNISCALKGHESYSSSLLYPPKLPSVSVSPSAEIVEGSSVTLTCSSDANPAANYTWYKENVILTKGSQLVFWSIKSSDSGEHYCTAENGLGKALKNISVNVKYPPKLPSVSVSPSAEIVEGSSVNLTCSSDANPAANYTWYKENKAMHQGPEGIYHFASISSEDRGIYYCKSENQFGWINSSSLFLNVLYPPKLPSVSVSPSAEIVEGSSVTLTCSSDANPAANYTWYKKNGNPDLQIISKQQLVFSSILSSDAGHYYCTAENKLGKKTSQYKFVNVEYPPQLPSVLVSHSAEIVEGSSVNLTCSSDANPAANYTWYKENEDSPKASGQIFTITDIRPERSGNYYCEAQNTRGRQNSTINLTVVKCGICGSWKLIIVATIVAISFCVIFTSVVLWIRKWKSQQSPRSVEKPNKSALKHSGDQKDALQYASIQFSKKQADTVYCNIEQAQLQRSKQKEEANSVEYTTVIFKTDSSALSNNYKETGEDPEALYSNIGETTKKQTDQNL